MGRAARSSPNVAASTHRFLFTLHGRRLGATRLCNGLLAAAELAGLRSPDGCVLVVTPHQLHRTWATGGMSLQALMALLGMSPRRCRSATPP
ncbi:hypothetical protein ACIBQX_19405 [Nonomuraea sp. NPDC049714]|uniref:hypothetical protein n=1 Tax=Nonomuraea sp. NPDC049714 TaxID=3364357 RepID=UPI0037AC151C